MAWTALLGLGAMLLVGAVVFLFVLWFLLPFLDSKVCPSCAAKRPLSEETCAVCGALLPGPADRHPGAATYGYPTARVAPPPVKVRVEDGQAYNRGITRKVVRLATAAMGVGIGLRVLGMLGALGLPQVPVAVDGILTIVGGLVAFVGFVFLDAA